MKHVIVIETPDNREIPTRTLQYALEATVENVLGKNCPFFIQSRFNMHSAIAATHEMFNAPAWDGK